MKKLITLAFLLTATIVFAEPPQTVALTNTSCIVLPERPYFGGALYATGTVYAQGSYVTNPAGQCYMALQAGTSNTNTPSHSHGSTNDSGVIWYAIDNTQPRSGYMVQNMSTSVLFYAVGVEPAVINAGSRLDAATNPERFLSSKRFIPDSIVNKQVSVINSSTNAVVGFQEW